MMVDYSPQAVLAQVVRSSANASVRDALEEIALTINPADAMVDVEIVLDIIAKHLISEPTG